LQTFDTRSASPLWPQSKCMANSFYRLIAGFCQVDKIVCGAASFRRDRASAFDAALQRTPPKTYASANILRFSGTR